MKWIPRPVPDVDALREYRYKSVNNTPLTHSDGNKWVPDEWQQRSNLQTLFEQEKLSIEDADAIKEFSQTFTVDEELVKSYLEHYLLWKPWRTSHNGSEKFYLKNDLQETFPITSGKNL